MGRPDKWREEANLMTPNQADGGRSSRDVAVKVDVDSFADLISL